MTRERDGSLMDDAALDVFRERVENYCSSGQTDCALDMIYDVVDDMLIEGHTEPVDRLLRRLRVQHMDIATMLGFLSITCGDASRLPSRPAYLQAVRDDLRRRGEQDRMGDLLHGLD